MRKASIRSFATFMASMILILLISCNNMFSNSTQSEFKIGAILPLTGGGSTVGEEGQKGIQLAVEDIKSQGLINKTINLIIEDDQTNPVVAATATSKLINQDKVQVIIGPMPSSSMLSSAPIAEKAKVIMLSPSASNPSITNAGEYIFRNWISDTFEAGVMSQYIFNDEKAKKVAVLYINNDYGVGLKNVFEEQFKKLGGIITHVDTYNQDSIDFRTQLVKIKASKPDRIYIPGHYKEIALILKQSKELGIDVPFRGAVTIEEPKLIKIAGSLVENIVYTSPYFDVNSSNIKVKNFVDKYNKKFGEKPGVFAAHSYDALMIIASTLKNSDSYTSDSIKNELLKINSFDGVSGSTTFDKYGDVSKPVSIKQVKNGEFVFLKTISLK